MARALHRRRPAVALAPDRSPLGPAPQAYAPGAESFDELAVMVDTFRPLELGEGGRAVDDGKYAASWLGGASRQGAGYSIG